METLSLRKARRDGLWDVWRGYMSVTSDPDESGRRIVSLSGMTYPFS